MKSCARVVASLSLAACVALSVSGDAAAQVGAGPLGSTAPTDTLTTRFEVNGLRVILRRNPANDVIAANLYLLGGTQGLTTANEGIESLILLASERGTVRYPGAAMRQRTAALGSEIGIFTTKDWTGIGLRAIRPTLDSSWMLFADRVMRPTLAAAEVELVRAQMLSGLRARESVPDELVETLADSLEFAGHPYALSPSGSVRGLSSLTVADLREQHRLTFVTSRMLLVIVGNVDRARVERLVAATLATLPRGNYSWTSPASRVGRPKASVIRPAPLPTNYILGYYAGPPAASADYAALRIATAVLSGRFFTEIRSRRNLSYAPDAPFLERAHATGGVYVTTVDPNAALRVMRDEIARLQRELIEPEGLERLIGQFITDYFLKNETNADQANFLARAEIYEGDFRKADQFVSTLRTVRPEDIRRVASQYMRNFRFVYLGDPTRIDPALLDSF
jgi:zinc protease